MRRFTPLWVAVALALTLPSTGAAASASPIKIRWASVLAPTDPNNVVALEVIAKIRERTKGGLDITLFPSSQLGKATEIFGQQKMGAPIIAETVASWSADLGFPKYQLLDGPFLFENVEQIDNLAKSSLLASWNEEFAKASGLRMLTLNWFGGYRHILGHKGFPTPADMVGLKFRIPESPVWLRTFELLGATPVIVPWAEIYNALSTGVVDAMESPLAGILSVKLHEAAKILTLTGHFAALRGFQISEKLFQSMPEEYRKILVEELVAGGVRVTKMSLDNHDQYLKTFAAAGVQIVNVDVEQFKAAVRPFYTEEKSKWTPQDYQDVLSALSGK